MPARRSPGAIPYRTGPSIKRDNMRCSKRTWPPAPNSYGPELELL